MKKENIDMGLRYMKIYEMNNSIRKSFFTDRNTYLSNGT